mgnify:FL=1
MSRIYKLLIIFLIFFSLFIIYLSSVGIKTDRFNPIILKKLAEREDDITADISYVYIKLDFLNLSLKLITNNPTILIQNIRLNIEEIESNISIVAFFSKKPVIKNLIINTDKNDVKDLVKIYRLYQNNFQTMLLDKLIHEGITKFQFYLNFNKNGKIKDDYYVSGKLNNFKIKLLNKKTIDSDLLYLIKQNHFSVNNLNFTYDKIEFNSERIDINKNKNTFYVQGDVYNSLSSINLKEFEELTKINLKNFSNLDTKFKSSSEFSFNIDKKLKLRDLSIKSKISLDELKYNVDEEYFYKIFGKTDYILIKNQNIDLTYTNSTKDGNEKILLNSVGNFDLNGNIDEFKYEYYFDKNKNKVKNKINLDNIPFNFDLINFKKNKKTPGSLIVDFDIKKKQNIKFNYLELLSNDNFLKINNLEISKKKKIKDFEKLILEYSNNKTDKFDISIYNTKENISIKSNNFNGKKIINKILEDENKSIFENLNKNIKIDLSKLFIDNNNYIENVTGEIKYKNNKIIKLNLDGLFNNGEALSIKTFKRNEELITNIFTNYPKPIIDRYKFIKGFEEGVLDFQSIKRNNKFNSLLIIDNFKVKEVPALAKILTLASLQGIADLLTGEGIRFTDFEMKYTSQNNIIEIEELYAIGPAISILMSGYIEKNKLVSLRGTLVPASTINRTISSIPLLGDILVGKKIGEGVFGVSFKIKGPPKNLKTTVNPIKTLTPRFITRTLEKIKD